MLRAKAASFTVALLLASVPSLAQRDTKAIMARTAAASRAYQNSRSDRDHGSGRDQVRRNQNFYNGVREGGHGGQYYEPRHANDGYDRRYHERGGIGPGKSALIGGAGGAVLGAALGGGLKGTLIAGAAGAGIGAVIGEAAQNHRDRRR
jgi:hypothetical protein